MTSIKKLPISQILRRLKAVLVWSKKHAIIIGIVFAALLYAILILQINNLNQREPTDDAVTEKLQTIKRPKVDQSVVDKLQNLQDNSTDVQSLFKAARDNPFQE